MLRHLRLPIVVFAMSLLAGCVRGPTFVPPSQRRPIDRLLVDYPGGMVLKEVVKNLTGPCDFEEDAEGNWIIAESGMGGFDPRIFGFKKDGTYFTIYPASRYNIPSVTPFNLIDPRFKIYGPLGGICCDNGRIYVTHRDVNGNGVVTAFNYDGSHFTVVAGLPAQGDNGMSDIAVGPTGRLWFGVGSATNSGVVGLDNWEWVKKHGDFCDKSFVDLKLNGYHFKSKNPDAGIGSPEIAVTAPFQPFNVSTETRIRRSSFPTGAIYSADPNGGGLHPEAHGIRAPRGLAFSEFGTLYITNNGSELRGTRPIADDPDSMLKIVSGGWYGFPDYSADLQPITDARFQPKGDQLKLLVKSGYREIAFLIDHNASNKGEGLISPVRNTLLQAVFPSLSGAARFEFVPNRGPLAQFQGNAIVPLGGDHAPFATSGLKIVEPQGFKIVRVDPTSREVTDFIRNTKVKPASMIPHNQGLLERPVAVKFGRDGSLYIVDFGEMDTRFQRFRVRSHTGRIFKLEAAPPSATTKPARASSKPTAAK